jgi:hypothetical protein
MLSHEQEPFFLIFWASVILAVHVAVLIFILVRHYWVRFFGSSEADMEAQWAIKEAQRRLCLERREKLVQAEIDRLRKEEESLSE